MTHDDLQKFRTARFASLCRIKSVGLLPSQLLSELEGLHKLDEAIARTDARITARDLEAQESAND